MLGDDGYDECFSGFGMDGYSNPCGIIKRVIQKIFKQNPKIYKFTCFVKLTIIKTGETRRLTPNIRYIKQESRQLAPLITVNSPEKTKFIPKLYHCITELKRLNPIIHANTPEKYTITPDLLGLTKEKVTFYHEPDVKPFWHSLLTMFYYIKGQKEHDALD